MLKILSWNCQYEYYLRQGLSEPKFKAITLYDFDVLVIQECTKKEFDMVKREFKYKNWYCDDIEDSVLGIAIFSNTVKIEFTESFNRNYRYVVPYKLITNGNEITLFSVWIKAPLDNTKNYVKVLFDAIDYYRPKAKAIIVGDINVGSNNENIDRYKELCSTLEKYHFFNAASNTKYEFMNTHWNNNGSFYQNDYCFYTNDIMINSVIIPKNDQWIKVNNSYKWDHLSDHSPIIVNFNI